MVSEFSFRVVQLGSAPGVRNLFGDPGLQWTSCLQRRGVARTAFGVPISIQVSEASHQGLSSRQFMRLRPETSVRVE